MIYLTNEQIRVVEHPLGEHAKTCVLMFNRFARLQFINMAHRLLPSNSIPAINTFHSYA